MKKLSLILLLVLSLLLFLPVLPVQAGVVSATGWCSGGRSTLLNLPLGGGIPLPREYGNASNSTVTITARMNTNIFFGAAHNLDFKKVLPPGIGILMSEAPVVPTNIFDMPIGTDLVVITITASSDTGSFAPFDVTACDYLLTLGLPEALKDVIQVPVRLCVLGGSVQAEGKIGPQIDSAGNIESIQTALGSNLLDLLAQVNGSVYLKYAHVYLYPAFAPNGIPVIGNLETAGTNVSPRYFSSNCIDPSTGFTPCIPGDVDSSRGSHMDNVNLDCENAWKFLYPDQRGILVTNVRLLVGNTDAQGVTPFPNFSLFFGGSRANDLCSQPRNLRAADVLDLFSLVDDLAWYHCIKNDCTFAIPGVTSVGASAVKTLAHELGHTLLLSHGNGLDDNMDGLVPTNDGLSLSNPGPRRYDSFCDPLAGDPPVEDSFTNPNPHSLMDGGFGSVLNLTPLQVETVRATAKVVPGATFSAGIDPADVLLADPSCGAFPCGVPPDVFLVKVAISETPGSQTTGFSHTTFGPIPLDATDQYLVFTDLDNNPATGCSPSTLNVLTSFQGAELVTRVSVATVGGEQQATPTVWRCQNGVLVQVNDFQILADIDTQTFPGGSKGFGHVYIQMPDAVRGPMGSTVRIQALAEQLGGQLNRLPKLADSGAVLSLVPPKPHQCSVTPPGVDPGGTMTVDASDLLPNQTAQVRVGDQVVATGAIDSAGNVHFTNVVFPSTSPAGLRPVSVLVEGTSASAGCVVLVSDARQVPATFATLSPSPDGSGWNNSNVTVTLTAVDIPQGPGIKTITYSATGAQTLASATVAGASASIPIAAEGRTQVSYFATDNGDLSEGPEQTTVKLDKTAPSITGSRTPGPNAFGWNNTDVTVNFNCTDTLSGVLSCPTSATRTAEAANQSVTGVAIDLALNTQTASVSPINIDKTPPTVAYSGNAGTYTVDQSVNILCMATDALSGVAVTTCAPIRGPAYSFPLGTNTFFATASDKADNVGTGSTSFTVLVTFDSLCNLTKQFIATSTRTPPQAQFLGSSLCSKLQAAKDAQARGNSMAKANIIAAYVNQVEANTPIAFTQSQSQILTRLAVAL